MNYDLPLQETSTINFIQQVDAFLVPRLEMGYSMYHSLRTTNINKLTKLINWWDSDPRQHLYYIQIRSKFDSKMEIRKFWWVAQPK